VTSLSVTKWDVNQPYTGTVMNFGSAQATFTQATGLPPGLSAGRNASTITLSGTPTQAGTFPVYLETVESDAYHVTTYEGTYNLTINPALSLGSLSAAPWTFGRAGSATIAVNGGTPAYSHLAVNGLPAGLTAALSGSTITLSGTPAAFGTFNNVAVSLQDSAGATVQRTYSLTVAALLSPGTLPDETAGQSYHATFSVTGGTGHYTFALASGALPAGLSLSSAGVLSGTATLAGGYRFAVRATDAATGGVIGTQSYYLFVNPAAPSRLVFGTPDKVYAGSPFDVKVRAVDLYGNSVPGVPVTLAPLPGTQSPITVLTGDAGYADFSLIETKAGTDTLTASAPGVAPTRSAPVTVLGGFPYNLALALHLPGNLANAGKSFHVTITGKDSDGNLSDYSGDVWLQSSDGQPVTPASLYMSHGKGEADVTLYQAGTVTLTAVYVYVLSQVTSAPITVTSAEATHFAVTPAVRSTFAGAPFIVTVTAQDDYGNTVTSYGGNVTLSSSDHRVVAQFGLVPGQGPATLPVTLLTPGDITLTASAGKLSGTSPSIRVLTQAGNGTASTQVRDAQGDTLILYTDGTVWEKPQGGAVWFQVEDSVSRLVSDAHGNVFTLDWYSNLKKLDSLFLWALVRSHVPSLVSDASGQLFVLNSSDNMVYEYDGKGSAQWSAWTANTSVPIKTLVSDGTGNVFVLADSGTLDVHLPGAYHNGLGWWGWMGEGFANLATNAGGGLFVLMGGNHSVSRVDPDPSGKWSSGSRFTPVLTDVASLAATPNGILLALGSDGILRYSRSGLSASWGTSLDLGGGVYTIAVTPNGVVYALPTSGGDLLYTTDPTSGPTAWLHVNFYQPGHGWSRDNGQTPDVRGLATGRDGQVYFLAAGNAYQVLTDGIGTVVRAHMDPTSWTKIEQAQMAKTLVVSKACSYLQRIDGPDSSINAVIQQVAKDVGATVQGTGLVQVIYDAAKLGKGAFTLAKDAYSMVHDLGNPIKASGDAIKLGFDLVGDTDTADTAKTVVDVVETVLTIAAVVAC
jgi:hypothetical protein